MFRPLALRALAAVLPVLLLAACSATDPTNPDDPDGPGDPGGPGNPGNPAAYTVSGRVTDSQGRPLAGVEVFADNTIAYDANVLAVTGADGRYTIDLEGIVPDSWRVGAYVERVYQGSPYRLRLVADNEQAFNAAPGVTRNLTWEVAGPRPDGSGYYGAFAFVYVDFNTFDFDVEQEYLELAFTPDGPIIDGSAGSTVVRRVEGGRIQDVPIGKYTVTARYAPPGEAPRALYLYADDDYVYEAATTAVFRDDALYGPHVELTLAATPD